MDWSQIFEGMKKVFLKADGRIFGSEKEYLVYEELIVDL